MKQKKILFRPSGPILESITDPPSPASSMIPDWYKRLTPNINGSSKPITKDFLNDKTVKACIPFLDSIVSGYMLRLPSDINCGIDEYGERTLSWITKDITPVETHNLDQVGDMPIPQGYDKNIFKFTSTWGIQTPPGYSLLFMHPFGRFDLPFYSLHAIVDSDLHYIPMNIPFVIKKDFCGIIKRGTPIAQVIPIKRDKWVSESRSFEEFDPRKITGSILLSIEKWYKERIWQKKDYK
jgi:hypothetical protein